MSSNADDRPELKPFAEFVKGRRKELGISVAEVAAALDVSPVTVYKIEDGSRPFIPKEGAGYAEYASVLECQPKELKALKPKEVPIKGTVRKMRANSRMAKELRQSAEELEAQDTAKRDSLIATQQFVRLELLEKFTPVAASIDGLEDGLRAATSDQPLGAGPVLDEVSSTCV